jgi:hypothetical protein
LWLLTSGLLLAADFKTDVLPVLEKRCQGCHGAQQQMAGLRLDRADESVAKVVQSGALVQRIESDKKGFRMPPVGNALEPAQIAAIKTWVASGGVWPQNVVADGQKQLHWSYRPIARPQPPDVARAEWMRHPVDRFIGARLEKEGVAPSPRADRVTLLRRVSLDLTGLPPSPEEVAEFLADSRPDAYERAIDRLLQSPHYGEKWARYWLDLAHYADSDGYEKDLPRPHAWRYRQWVIEALNRDLPFDRFVTEQLAGDLLPGATVEQKVATGFLRQTLTNREGGVDRKEARFEELVNRTNTVGTVFLGLTLGCAQCHNHKYDPISRREYYQLLAFFDQSEEAEIDAPVSGEAGPYLRALGGYRKKRDEVFAKYKVVERFTTWRDKLRQALQNPGKDLEWDFALTAYRAMVDYPDRALMDPSPSPRTQEVLMRHFLFASSNPDRDKDQALNEALREARKEVEALDKTLPPFTQAMVMTVPAAVPQSHERVGGDYRTLGPPVEPGGLAVLPPMPAGPRNRLTLAQWLVAKDNPLPARVAMNRLWQELFGRGLARTSEDFGFQGEKPSHPELLDWLASEFMHRDWSWKQMVRLVVTSETYQQASAARPELNTKDPDNLLLARQNRIRLTAELIRDAALRSSGLLHPVIGGRSVKPPQPAGVAELGYSGGNKWYEETGLERYRRGLYIHYQRTTPYPLLATFDAPDAATACSRRRRSNTSLQALNLLNDPVFFEAAQALAARVLREQSTTEARLNHAFRLTVGREPRPAERARLARLLDQQLNLLAKDESSIAKLMPAPPEGMAPREAAAWTGVSRVLLNTDEFMTRE